MGFPGGSDGKESACNKCPGKGNGNSLQYSCFENPLDRGAWWATVHGVTKSWTDFTERLSTAHSTAGSVFVLTGGDWLEKYTVDRIMRAVW